VPSVVADEVAFQRAGNALIEKEQHALRSSRGRVPGRRRPAPG
jgi:hypothetical protein